MDNCNLKLDYKWKIIRIVIVIWKNQCYNRKKIKTNKKFSKNVEK